MNNPLNLTDPSGYLSAYGDLMMEQNWHEGGSFYYRGNHYVKARNKPYFATYGGIGGGGGGGGGAGLLGYEGGPTFFDKETGIGYINGESVSSMYFYYSVVLPQSTTPTMDDNLGSGVTILGIDGLGNQEVLYEDLETGYLSVQKLPFWRITGSYYNELYYFSGLVAFDIYAAQASMNSIPYGSTASEIVTLAGSTASFYKNLPGAQNPTIHKNYVELNYTNGKLLGKVGKMGDFVSLVGAGINVHTDPRNVEYWSDLFFAGIGWVPIFGDLTSSMYAAGKDQVYIIQENIRKNQNPLGGVYVPATGDIWFGF